MSPQIESLCQVDVIGKTHLADLLVPVCYRFATEARKAFWLCLFSDGETEGGGANSSRLADLESCYQSRYANLCNGCTSASLAMMKREEAAQT